MTISIHPLTTADLDYADAIQQAAYGGGSRKDRLQLYMSLQPDGWLLATLDGEPAGIAGGTNYGTVGQIGLVAVDPSMQRHGVALAMVEHADSIGAAVQLTDWLGGGNEGPACVAVGRLASDE